MSGKTRFIISLAIVTVAGVAAWASYWHITDLSLILHQPPKIAYVIALGVDGPLTVGSLALLGGKRIGWAGIAFGLTVSIYANVMSGISYGTQSALWAGVPSVSLFVSMFVLERWLSKRASPESTQDLVLDAYAIALDTLCARHVLDSAVHAVVSAERVLSREIVLPEVTVTGPQSVTGELITEEAPIVVPEYLAERSVPVRDVHPVPVPAFVPPPEVKPVVRENVVVQAQPKTRKRKSTPNADHGDVLAALRNEFGDTMPTVRDIKARMHVGTPKAQRYYQVLKAALGD